MVVYMHWNIYLNPYWGGIYVYEIAFFYYFICGLFYMISKWYYPVKTSIFIYPRYFIFQFMPAIFLSFDYGLLDLKWMQGYFYYFLLLLLFYLLENQSLVPFLSLFIRLLFVFDLRYILLIQSQFHIYLVSLFSEYNFFLFVVFC